MRLSQQFKYFFHASLRQIKGLVHSNSKRTYILPHVFGIYRNRSEV